MNQVAINNKLNTRTSSVLKFIISEFKPRGKVITPFNLISGFIIFVGFLLVIYRFAFGLSAVSNLNQDFPWGIWKGFVVVTGVAFAAGAYVTAFMVYVLGMKKYHNIVRLAVLNGFLAYCFYAGALVLDLGRPWNIINPIIGNSFGYSSVLFLVAWHFMLYMIAQFIEFTPTIAEWLHLKKIHKITALMTIGTVIFGICLSVLHQSGLGALFLLAKGKIHPLWYTEFIPILFLVSSIYSGLCIVILVTSLCQRVFAAQISPQKNKSFDDIMFGFGRIITVSLFIYFFLKALVLIHDLQWDLLNSKMGAWYLVEVLGFVLIPFILFAASTKNKNKKLLLTATAMAVIGIVLNRLNISVIAYRWYDDIHYRPSWMEIWITATIILAQIWTLRWIINRMPVLSDPPQWARAEVEDD